MITDLQKQALALIAFIDKRRDQYQKVNDVIRKLQRDFPTHLHAIDPECFQFIVDLLDKILGDGLASYFLFECVGEDGGCITVDGVEYKIRNVKDIEIYLNMNLK